MKTKHFFLVVLSLWFCYLFYEQNLGINLLAFNVALLLYFAVFETNSFKTPLVFVCSAGALVSSIFMFVSTTPLAFIANFLSLALLSALIFAPKLSFLNALFQGLGKLFLSVPFSIFHLAKIKKEAPTESNVVKKLLLVLLAVGIVAIFFVLYQNSNPEFYSLTQKINFKWIKLPLIRFFIFSAFIVLALCSPILIKSFVEKDNHWLRAPLNQDEEKYNNSYVGKSLGIQSEIFLAIVLFSLLNLLLAVVNGVDIVKLWAQPGLPESMKSFSAYVHNGVNTLILSIVFAVSIILFFFRGYTSFLPEFKHIRTLSIIWVAQNAFLLISTAYRNSLYIGQYGLSHKRIGVLIYLLLALIGLLFTVYKIVKNKNNYFLFNINAIAFYIVMFFFVPFNWDHIITQYNLSHYEHNTVEIDVHYLCLLGHGNIIDLVEYKNAHPNKFTTEEIQEIDDKLNDFIVSNQFSDWQSYSISKSNILKKYNHESH